MKLKAIGFVLIVAVGFSWQSQQATAAFIENSIYVVPGPGSTPYSYHSTEYHLDGTASLTVEESWENEHGSQYSFDVGGETTAVTPFHIIKEVNNATGLTWVGYKIDLSPLNGFELSSPPPTSDTFTLTSSSANSLEFGLPSPVGPGDTVTFDFVINVTGAFSFTLTQTPIAVPEPAAAILCLTAIACFAARRRRTR
jgi:hypothetical protein